MSLKTRLSRKAGGQYERFQRNIPRSTGAVLAGLIAVFVLSLGTDKVMHALEVYPPWGQPMTDTGLLLLALTYRYGIAIWNMGAPGTQLR